MIQPKKIALRDQAFIREGSEVKSSSRRKVRGTPDKRRSRPESFKKSKFEGEMLFQ